MIKVFKEFQIIVDGKVVELVWLSNGQVKLKDGCQVAPDDALRLILKVRTLLGEYCKANQDHLDKLRQKPELVDPELQSHREK